MSETTRHPAFNYAGHRTPLGDDWRRAMKAKKDAWRDRWAREYAHRWVKRANGYFPVDQYAGFVTVKVYGCFK